MHRLTNVRRQVNIQDTHIRIFKQKRVIVGSGQKRIRAARNNHRLRWQKAASRMLKLHADGVKSRIANVLDGMESFSMIEMRDDS